MRVDFACIALRAMLIVAFALAATMAAQTAGAQDVLITELMAANSTTLLDEDGDSSDWIEIYNNDALPVELDGWYLTDKQNQPSKWQFPAATVAAGEYLLIFASGKNRSATGAQLHTNFKLSAAGEYLGVLRPDLSVAHEYAPEYPQQSADVSYGLASDLITERCFLDATPGSANDDSTACLFVTDLEFSAASGFYDAAFAVEISSATPGSTIRYTLDGTIPDETAGVLYTVPLTIGSTTILRARAFRADLQPSTAASKTYLFINDVVAQTGDGFPLKWGGVGVDYAMDPRIVDDPAYSTPVRNGLKAIPTLSIVMEPGHLFGAADGVYSHPRARGVEWERPASAELIYSDGRDGFHINCGIRIQGGLSRDPQKTRKHSLRLLFKGIYGPTKLVFPLFSGSPVDRFDTLSIKSGHNKSWAFGIKRAQYIRDQWSRDTQIAMGRPAAHGIHVHLYLNGLYWGLYNLMERPSAAFAAEHLGGSKEEWDALNSGKVVDGNNDAWKAAHDLADGGLASAQAYAQMRELVDVPNLIDYMLLNFYMGSQDWDDQNWYAARRRLPGAGWRFFAWDSEQAMELVNAKRIDLNFGGKPTHLNVKLRENAEYRRLFGDLAHRHLFNGGALTSEAGLSLFLAHAATLVDPVVAESARWGDAKRPNTPYSRDNEWLVEQQWMRLVFFPQRSAVFLRQLRDEGLYPTIDAPVFNRHGGGVASAFELSMQASAGTIYYTTDGSDPRLEGGAVSASATAYTAPLTLNQAVEIKSRALSAGSWSAINQAVFTIDRSLRITEIMFNPAGVDGLEFIELANVGEAAVDVTGFAFTQGIEFVFGPTIIEAGRWFVLVSDQAAFESAYGATIDVVGEYAGRLSNGGEELRLADASGATALVFDYDDQWYPASDGGGRSLVLRDPTLAADGLGERGSWRASAIDGGSPGAAEAPLCSDGVDNDGDGLVDFPADPGCQDGAQDGEDPQCDDGIDNDADGLVDVADPQCETSWHESEAPEPIDDFLCYKAKTNRGGERFERVDIDLDGGFDGLKRFTVRKPKVICNPADLNRTGSTRGPIHLEGYQIRESTGEPKHLRRMEVFVHNSFGPLFVDTSKPDRLLVASALSSDAPVAAPAEASHPLDNYKCFKIRLSSAKPKYFPSRVRFPVVEDFEDRSYELKKPTRLCLPVAVDGGIIKTSERRLLCYKAKRSRGEASHTRREGIHVANRFGSERLDTRSVDELCLESR